MVTIGVVSVARTRLPGCTCSSPVLPVSGARMVAYCSWTFAFSMLARSSADRRVERRGVGDDLIDLFLRRDAALEEVLVACRLRFGVRRLRDVAVERRLRLLQRRFERPLVDLDDDLPFRHFVAFDEVHRRQLAGDLRADGHRRCGDHRADPLDRERHRLLHDRRRRDRHDLRVLRRRVRRPRVASKGRLRRPSRLPPPRRQPA